MRHFACAALAVCLASPALAQSGPAAGMPSPDSISQRDTLTLGAGGAYIPDFEGSKDYRLVPLGAIRGQYHGITFTSRGAYLLVDLIPQKSGISLDAGPMGGVRFGRRDNIKDPVVSLLPTRKAAIELGGFAGVSFHGVTNPYGRLSAHVEVLQDVSNAHKSAVVTPTLEFSTPLSIKTFASVSLCADIVSSKYNQYYFGITPADSLVSGLPAYSPGGGMKDWKTGLLLNQSITGNLLGGLSVFGYGEYMRLTGDARRSPIVTLRGSPNQWTAAAGLAYTW